MKVSDAIERAESVYRFSGGQELLLAWLTELEERISLELFQTERKTQLGIDDVLSAPNAYAELYPLYLVMKGSFAEGKTEKYNSFARCFERAYSEYVDHVNRTRIHERNIYYKIL